MTNEELFADLKQFVAVTVSQATAGLATKNDLHNLKDEMNQRFEGVNQRFEEVNQRFEEVNQSFEDVDVRLNEIQNAIGSSLEETETTVHDHEKRLTKLEHNLA